MTTHQRNLGLVLYYLPGEKGAHITRTRIAGCMTECGVILQKGTPLTTIKPTGRLCYQCQEAIRRLKSHVPHGIDIDAKWHEWMRLKDYAP
jgi:hypothetical protein